MLSWRPAGADRAQAGDGGGREPGRDRPGVAGELGQEGRGLRVIPEQFPAQAVHDEKAGTPDRREPEDVLRGGRLRVQRREHRRGQIGEGSGVPSAPLVTSTATWRPLRNFCRCAFDSRAGIRRECTAVVRRTKRNQELRTNALLSELERDLRSDRSLFVDSGVLQHGARDERAAHDRPRLLLHRVAAPLHPPRIEMEENTCVLRCG